MGDPSMKTPPRVPVTIITGFLGAGKTSLLNHILSGDHGRRIAVLVNDFGSVNIDADLVQNRSGEVLSLENGCICCSLSDGLLVTALRLIRQDGTARAHRDRNVGCRGSLRSGSHVLPTLSYKRSRHWTES